MSYSEMSPTPKKVGVAFDAGEAGEELSPAVSTNPLQQNASGDKEQSTPSKENILVVDDTSDNLYFLITILSEKGYNVRLVSSGKLALMAVQSSRPDLILLDIMMPKMDGYEVCSKLKASPQTKDIPIIFISALNEVFDKTKVFSLGGVDYIAKPFHQEEVLARIENQLRLQRLSKQLNEQNAQLSEEIEERKIAQEKLKESEKRYRQLFEGSVDGIVIVDIGGGIIDCNARYQKMLGYSLEELKQKRFWEIIPVKWHEWEAEIIEKQIIKRGYSDTYEKEYIRKDGTVFSVEETAYCQKNDSGQPEMRWAVVRDISARQQDEKERSQLIASIKKSEASLAQAQRIAHFGSWEFDVLTGKITWSEEKFRIFGLDQTKGEPTFAELIELIHPDDRALFRQNIQRAIADGIPYEFDFRIKRPESSIRHLDCRGEPVFNEQKQVIQLFGTVLDITERNQTEEALAQSAATNRALLSGIPDMIFRCRADGTYLDFKPAPDIKTLVPPSVFFGKKVQEVLPPQLVQAVFSAYEQAIRSGETQIFEYQLPIDDQLHDYEARIVAKDSDEIIAIVRDITDRKLAQAAIAESERKYRNLVETSQDIIWSTDTQGRFTFVNQAVRQVFGSEPSEMLERQFTDFTPPERLALDLAVFQNLLNREPVRQYETIRLAKDNRPIHLLLNALTLLDEQGQVVGATGTASDISDRKQVEEKLRQSEGQLNTIVTNTSDGILIVDRLGQVRFANPAAVQIFHRPPESLIDYPLGVPVGETAEVELVDPNGEYRIAELKAAPTQWRGESAYIIALRDITDRKRTEEALRQSEERWQLAIKAINAGIWDKNFKTGEVFHSARWKEMLGYKDHEIFNSSEEWNSRLHPDDAGRVKAALKAHLDQKTPYYIAEYRLRSKDGSYKWILSRGQALWDEQGFPVRFVGSHEDITARKQALDAQRQSEAREREKATQLEQTLDELKLTQAQLIQTEKMSSLGRMVAGVAHEINNPVSFIYGNLTPARHYFQDLLRLVELYQQTYPHLTPEIQQLTSEIELDFLVEDWQKLMNSMQVGAERIHEIVRSLRNFSRLDEKELKPVDIHEGIDNTLLILQHRLKAEGISAASKRSVLRPEIEVFKEYGQLPKVTCYASQLNQVFMNLLSNAIDALENRPSPRVITIRTSVVSGQSLVVSGKEQQTTDNGQLTSLSFALPTMVLE